MPVGRPHGLPAVVGRSQFAVLIIKTRFAAETGHAGAKNFSGSRPLPAEKPAHGADARGESAVVRGSY